MQLIPDRQAWERRIAVLAFSAALANLVSIAAAHILLAAGLAVLALRPREVRVPRIAWPLLALVVWTLVSAAMSEAPQEAFPQVKKFFVLGMLPLAYSAFRTTRQCRRAAESWHVAVLLACLVATAQFLVLALWAPAGGGDFYSRYSGQRITGFYSHWMTFSQVSTLVLVTLGCQLAFGRRRPGMCIWLAAASVMVGGLLFSFTRSAWLAIVVCGAYLLAVRRPRALVAVPALLAVLYLAAPEPFQRRVLSMRPAPGDSRLIMWRTGLNMIEDHPLTGVGPERVGPLFSLYQPDEAAVLPPGFYGHLHNVYIHYAAERGLPAAVIVLWLFAQVLRDLRSGLLRLRAARSDRRFLLHAGVAGTLALAVLGCFDVALGDSEVLGTYLALLAISYRALAFAPREERSPLPPETGGRHQGGVPRQAPA